MSLWKLRMFPLAKADDGKQKLGADVDDVDDDLDDADDDADSDDDDDADSDDDDGDSDDDADDDDDADSDDDDADDDSDADDDVEPPAKKPKDKPKERLFTQAEVDVIIEKRLARSERKYIELLSDDAGVDLDPDDVKKAVKLWGVLSTNLELSQDVNEVIQTSMTEGKAKLPQKTGKSARELDVARKEAIVDLKLADPVFRTNADAIIAWAEDEDIEIKDAKTLKLAVLAWKSSGQARVAEASRKLSKQKQSMKQKQKSDAKKKAKVQPAGAHTGKTTKPKNYRKMSEEQILSDLGMSLITED